MPDYVNRMSPAALSSLPVARPALSDGRPDGPSYKQLLSENNTLKSQIRSARARRVPASERRASS